MKVSPENLSKAIAVVGLKPQSSKEKFYWNGYHRLERHPDGESLLLETTDGKVWFEWRVPAEGDLPPLGVNVERNQLASLKDRVAGGKLDITQDKENEILTLKRGQLQLPLPYEAPSEPYPGPEVGETVATWTFRRETLEKALRYAHQFIGGGGTPDKEVATLYREGTLITGTYARQALVEGVRPKSAAGKEVEHISFTAEQAKVTADFLRHLGETVEVSFAGSPVSRYVVRDPASGNKLVLYGTQGRYKTNPADLARQWRETNVVSRQGLLDRARLFSGASAAKVVGLRLTFRGEGEHSAAEVSTTQPEERRRCSDELINYREFAEGVPAAQTMVMVQADHLIEGLPGMGSKCVRMSYDGKLLKITEDVDLKEQSEGEQDLEQGEEPAPLRRALILVYREPGKTGQAAGSQGTEQRHTESLPNKQEGSTPGTPAMGAGDEPEPQEAGQKTE